MQTFIQKYAEKVIGVLSGFDRLVFRGALQGLCSPRGMMAYLRQRNVLLKDFDRHVKAVTNLIRQAQERLAAQTGRPLVHLPSAATCKEDEARQIAARDGVREGLVCIFKVVEPCMSFEVQCNHERQLLELRSLRRACTHYYQYWIDPQVGWMNARLESWFPFNIQLCLNGRERLARQMDQNGLQYVKRDNCFPWVSDMARAQALLEEQARTDWPALLNRLAARLNPAAVEIFQGLPAEYYWTAHQSEWATDVLFRNAATLAALYPQLIRHGLVSFGSPDVLRFLGRKVPASGTAHGSFQGELTSDFKRRPEGVRLKHRLGKNSVKVYDKQGSVLRVETTINDPRDFQAYRTLTGQEKGQKAWLRMRKGVADLRRRGQVSQAANERYLEALAALDPGEPLGRLTDRLCRPVEWRGKRFRALNPGAPDDVALLTALNRGEFAINGLRNRDLAVLLGPSEATPEERRLIRAKITRQLRWLRAHGLIRKVQHTHRYLVTLAGRQRISAILTARASDVKKLTTLAA